MRIFVTVNTNSKESRIARMDNTHYRVWTNEPAVGGRANMTVIKLLASNLGIPPSHLTIIRGMFSKEKIIDIVDK